MPIRRGPKKRRGAKNKLAPNLEEAQAKFKKEIKKILILSAEEAVQFFQANITGRQGFLNRKVTKWPKRKRNVDPGRRYLSR